MRTSVLSCVFALACFVPQAGAQILPQADAHAIRQQYHALTAAGVTDQYGHLGRFFTQDAVWMPAGQPAVQGRAAVEKWFTTRARQWTVKILELDGSSNFAYTRSAYTLDLDIPNFKPITGKSLEVWRKQPDGSWLLARFSFSPDAAGN